MVVFLAASQQNTYYSISARCDRMKPRHYGLVLLTNDERSWRLLSPLLVVVLANVNKWFVIRLILPWKIYRGIYPAAHRNQDRFISRSCFYLIKFHSVHKWCQIRFSKCWVVVAWSERMVVFSEAMDAVLLDCWSVYFLFEFAGSFDGPCAINIWTLNLLAKVHTKYRQMCQ